MLTSESSYIVYDVRHASAARSPARTDSGRNSGSSTCPVACHECVQPVPVHLASAPPVAAGDARTYVR